MRHASLLLPTLVLTLVSCTTATMQIDPALAARAEPMLVSGSNPRVWNRPLSFGNFRTEQVSEGGEWRWAVPILGSEAGYATQRYRLTLTDGSQRLQTECKTHRVFIERDGLVVDPSLGNLPVLICAMKPEDGGEPWVLTLRSRGVKFSGTLEPGNGGAGVEVKSVHRAEGGAFDTVEPVGYTVSEGGSVIGAVESVNRGRVWLDPAADSTERLRMAATSAALLLFDPKQ